MFVLLSSLALANDVPEAAAHLGKGIHVELERRLDHSAEEVWGLIAHDYVGIDAWAELVEASREMSAEDLPEGFEADPDAPVIGRVVTTGFGEVSETLVDYDEEAMTFTFRAGGLPDIIAYSQNTQSVVDHGDGTSTVRFDIYMVPKGPAKLMKRKLKRRFEENLGHVLVEVDTALGG